MGNVLSSSLIRRWRITPYILQKRKLLSDATNAKVWTEVASLDWQHRTSQHVSVPGQCPNRMPWIRLDSRLVLLDHLWGPWWHFMATLGLSSIPLVFIIDRPVNKVLVWTFTKICIILITNIDRLTKWIERKVGYRTFSPLCRSANRSMTVHVRTRDCWRPTIDSSFIEFETCMSSIFSWVWYSWLGEGILILPK